MKDALMQRLLESLDGILDAIRAGVGQLPSVAQEALHYWFIEAVAFAVIYGLGCLLCLALALLSLYILRTKDTWDTDVVWTFGVVFGGLGAVALGIFTVINVLAAVRISLAPRLYLIEQLSRRFQ